MALVGVILLLSTLTYPSYGTDELLSSSDDPNLPITAASSTVTNMTQIVVLANRTVNLPCDISLPNNHEQVTLILWYREDIGVPIFSLEVGPSGGLASADVWSDDEWLGTRATFRPEAFPARLMVHDVMKSDAGQYRCRVDFTEAPTRNTLINLTVIVPPSPVVIFDETGSPRTTYVGPYREGSSMTLICDAFNGVPIPSVKWWHNGNLVDDTYQVLANGTVRNEITFPHLDRTFLHNEISCEVENTNLTRPIRNTVTVDMNFAPMSISIDNKEEIFVAGRPSEIICRSSGSRPPAHITWFLNEKRLTDATHSDSSDGNTSVSILSFLPRLEDIGKILMCKATNALIEQSTLSDHMELEIDYAPRVELALGASISYDNIYEGGDVYFDCRIDAQPPPTKVMWQFNNEPLTQNPSGGIILTNQSLVLQSIERSRTGSYTCQAANSIGKGSSQEIFLDVKYVPVCAHSEPIVYGVGKGEMVDVFCDIVANPTSYNFQWSFNNSADYIRVPPSRVLKVNGTRSKLTYTPLNNKDYGTLMCSATNEVGHQRNPCIFHIILAVAPDPVSNCTIINKSSETFHLQCIPGFDGGMEQEFVVSVAERKSGKVVYNQTTKKLDLFIQHLSEGTFYLTTVTPTNKKGVGKPTHVIVETLQHPAVELTLSEGVDDSGVIKTGREAQTEKDEWAVLTGALVGTLGCVTILVVASLVIRFCVCPVNRHNNSAFVKSDLSPNDSFGGGPPVFDHDDDIPSFDLGFVGGDSMVVETQGNEMPLTRKGILKHTFHEETGWDRNLEHMVNAIDMIPPPPFNDDFNPPTVSESTEAKTYQQGGKGGSGTTLRSSQVIGTSSTLPRRLSREGLLCDIHPGPQSSIGSQYGFPNGEGSTDPLLQIPQELSAVLTLKRGMHVHDSNGRHGRDGNKIGSLPRGMKSSQEITLEPKRTPLLKRKRESIV